MDSEQTDRSDVEQIKYDEEENGMNVEEEIRQTEKMRDELIDEMTESVNKNEEYMKRPNSLNEVKKEVDHYHKSF